MVTGIRSNMKNKVFALYEKALLRKRGIIESVFDFLTTVCNLEHTRHRSPANAMVNMISAVIAYNFLNRKPSLKTNKKLLCK